MAINGAKASGGGAKQFVVGPYDFVGTDLERHLTAHKHGKDHPQWDEKHSRYSYTRAFGPDCLLVRTTSRLNCFGRGPERLMKPLPTAITWMGRPMLVPDSTGGVP